MMIEDERKSYPNHKQDAENQLIGAGGEQADKVGEQDYAFGHNHIRHNRADKEPFFALEDYAAGRTTFPDIERPIND